MRSRIEKTPDEVALVTDDDEMAEALLPHDPSGLHELEKREPQSAEFIRPRVPRPTLSFASTGRDENEPLSATLLLAPTISHPDLAGILTAEHREAMHVKLARDEDGKPIDALHIHSYAPREITKEVEQEIWKELGVDEQVPDSLGSSTPAPAASPLPSPS